MRLLIENEDGKKEAVFVPAMAVREAQLELGAPDPDDQSDGHGFATAVFCGWWVWKQRGLTDAETWEDFALTHSVMPAPDADPNPPPG